MSEVDMMKELRTDTIINASPGTVWNVLTDFYGYASWSSFIEKVDGNPDVGGKLEVTMSSGNGKDMKFKPRVLVSEPEKEFRWKGKLNGMGWLFSGEHFFLIEDAGEGRTRLVHGEIFTGFLVPMLWRSLNTDTRRGFLEFNKALKRKAESMT
jgi:hypothetical protein